MFSIFIALCRWREGLPECVGLNHHLVKEITLRALKRADIRAGSGNLNRTISGVSA
jgi:hypothetical protein